MLKDQQLKADWVAALRSNNWQQGAGKLRDADNKYCCLGVLCDILDQGEWESTDLGFEFRSEIDGDLVLSDRLPPELRKELGMEEMEEDRLIDLNDGETKYKYDNGDMVQILPQTFAQIADWIEEHL